MTNEELISKIKDFANEQKELLNGFELQSDFRSGETAAYSAIISFLDTLESEKPIEQEKEVKPCHKTRNRLAEWSKTPEGRMAYEKVAEEMRKEIAISNCLDEAATCAIPESYGSLEVDCYGGSEPVYSREQIKEMFIAGAKWQKQHDDKELSEKIAAAYQLGLVDKEKQMMKEAVEGQVFGATDVKALYEGKVYVISNLVQDTDYNLHPNDKVRIIIVKD